MWQKRSVLIVVSVLFLFSCTKLDEKFRSDLTQGGVSSDSANTAALLTGVYNALANTFTNHLIVFPLNELTTDEAIAPTRGPDWDDNGKWRVLHAHTWNETNSVINDCFNNLNGVSYLATDMLRYHPTNQQQAEVRFIRAWVMYSLLDLFNQVPYRNPGEDVVSPARVRTGVDALNYIISELDSIENDLPSYPAYVANKYADKFLLMKCYLNKAVFKNRADPQQDVEDMNKVIQLADDIIKSGEYFLNPNYFDNFGPDNTAKGTENIFTQLGERGVTFNNAILLTWIIALNYSQNPPGANGWATLSDFYNRFDSTDKRRGVVYSSAGSPPNPGNRINVGFLIGQQYDLSSDTKLLGGETGVPLIYTPEVHNTETGSNYEVTGIRPLKYFPDYQNIYGMDNDLVYFRFADVLLMKAEAIKRGGKTTNAGIYGSTPEQIVNSIRTDPSRNAPALTNVTLDDIYDERGRELWWEGWRREDMIRFGKFLKPFQEKEYESDPKYLLFPIPNTQVAANPYLQQNPGY